MELGEIEQGNGQSLSVLSAKVRKLEKRRNLGKALSIDEDAHGYFLVFAATCATTCNVASLAEWKCACYVSPGTNATAHTLNNLTVVRR